MCAVFSTACACVWVQGRSDLFPSFVCFAAALYFSLPAQKLFSFICLPIQWVTLVESSYLIVLIRNLICTNNTKNPLFHYRRNTWKKVIIFPFLPPFNKSTQTTVEKKRQSCSLGSDSLTLLEKKLGKQATHIGRFKTLSASVPCV